MARSHGGAVADPPAEAQTSRLELAPPEMQTAPMPPGADDEFDDGDGKTMEQWLIEAGAKRTRRGRWYREVPDPRVPKEVVVQNGKVFLRTTYTTRMVAIAEDPYDAILKARALNGTHDAYLPGVGWIRNGWKPEREHPTNVGVIQAGPTRFELEEIPIDTAEAQKALALKGALKAAADELRQETED